MAHELPFPTSAGATRSGAGSGNVGSRLATAAVLIPPVVWLLWRGGWPAVALISAATALTAREFYLLAPGGRLALWPVGTAVAAALPWLPWLWPSPAAAIALALLAATSLLGWAWPVVRQRLEAAPHEPSFLVEGVVFCALGPYFLSALLLSPDGSRWVLAVLAATFCNDAAAFFGGKLFGHTRLAPKVSPGKTWEGLGFGALGSAAAAAVAVALWPKTLFPLDAVVLALTTCAVGPLGDLAKSLLKRSRGVKDAGRLLPGHGGMLDRVDALLVNAPLIWAWVTWVR